MIRTMGRAGVAAWVGAAAICCAAAEPKVFFEIDGTRRWPISPYLYGTNQPDWQGRGKHLTLARWGGNRITAYNWETNASNAGSDWQHQNDGWLDPSDVPGNPVRKLVAAARGAGASVIVTVPILGYAAADKAGGGDVGKTPGYLESRFLPSFARKRAGFCDPPDLADGRVFQDEFVGWLERAFPDARRDPARTIFYALDNEPDLWASTHARIHPKKTRYDEIVRLNIEYARAIKAVAPRALVFGPVSYGWHGFTTLQDAPDGGGRDFLDCYLHAMRCAEEQCGMRLLDVLDLHWYPEARGGNIRITEDDAHPEVSAARVQAPRSLWDPAYVEASWITRDALHGPIRLLPRLREKIAARYPGTRLALTEYYYGGGGDISGALAQADALGIFGREGVFAAALWEMGRTDQRFLYAAMAMFRNYDGRGGAFGDTGLSVQTNDVARTSVYASINAQGQVILVALNKTDKAIPVRILLKDSPATWQAEVFRLSETKPQPTRDEAISGELPGELPCDLPAMSVSTLRLTSSTRTARREP